MAKLRVLNALLGLLFAIFGLLAHHGLADVSHIINREYLPPIKENSNELVYKIIHEYAPSFKNNRNYLPPHNPTQQIRLTKSTVPAKDMRASPNYEFQYPAIDLAPPKAKSAQTFRGAGYLPPHKSFAANQPTSEQSSYGAYNLNEQKTTQTHAASQQFTINVPTHLPPGYDFKNPSEGQGQPKTQQEYNAPRYLPPSNGIKNPNEETQQEFSAPRYLPTGYDFKNPQTEESVPEAGPNTHLQNVQPFQLPVELPAGYDFVKPAGSEAAIAELHTSPNDNDGAQKLQQQQNLAYAVQQPKTGYLPPQNGKIRTVQILNSVAVKTLRVLETEQNGVKHIKILGHTNDVPTGDHSVVKVEVPGSYAHTIKIFNNHDIFPINSYAAPQASNVSHKRSVRVSSEANQTSL